jgi:signal transduction histidine kinase
MHEQNPLHAQAEERVKEIEFRNRALLDAIPDTMLRIRSDGIVLDLRSRTDTDPIAWPSDLIGGPIQNAPLPPDTVGTLADAMAAALNNGQMQIVEYPYGMDDRTWSFEVRIVKSGADEVVAIFRDVTRYKRAVEREIQAGRLSAMAQMIAGLAHESRNAFQRSQASLEMLALEVEDQPETLQLVQQIQKAQDHLHYLYEEVNDYAAPIKLDRHKCDIAQVWRDTWAHLEVERSRKNVSLHEENACPDATCRADPNALEQVFRNVLENAIVACPEQGRIMIRCLPVRLAGEAAIEIRVADDGPGLEADVREKIFEPFFTTKTKGTGLGLAIARRLVEAHGGSITAGEGDGAGTEILIVVPRGAV